jgi:hypothetical protein
MMGHGRLSEADRLVQVARANLTPLRAIRLRMRTRAGSPSALKSSAVAAASSSESVEAASGAQHAIESAVGVVSMFVNISTNLDMSKPPRYWPVSFFRERAESARASTLATSTKLIKTSADVHASACSAGSGDSE